MPNKARPLPRSGKSQVTPPAKRTALPIALAGVALIVIIVGLVLLATPGRGSFGSGGPVQVAGRPALVIDRELIDFGRVPLDIPIKATFQLSNAGDEPLQILNQPVVEVKQGC